MALPAFSEEEERSRTSSLEGSKPGIHKVVDLYDRRSRDGSFERSLRISGYNLPRQTALLLSLRQRGKSDENGVKIVDAPATAGRLSCNGQLVAGLNGCLFRRRIAGERLLRTLTTSFFSCHGRRCSTSEPVNRSLETKARQCRQFCNFVEKTLGCVMESFMLLKTALVTSHPVELQGETRSVGKGVLGDHCRGFYRKPR